MPHLVPDLRKFSHDCLKQRRRNGVSNHLKSLADSATLPDERWREALQAGALRVREPPGASISRKRPMVRIDTPKRRAYRVKRHVPPVSNDARAGLSPRVPSVP